MTVDDITEYGRETDADSEAAANVPERGVGVTDRTWRRLGHELTNARSIADFVGTVERYGWTPPLLALALLGVVRGVFAYLSEPFAMSQGYVFAGWQLALGINLLYGLFFVGFVCFFYFGVAGAIAGHLSEETAMETAMFKVGGYLMLLFVPVVVVSAVLVTTIPAPETVVAGAEPVSEVVASHEAVANSPQMRIVGTMMAGVWILVGFLLLPVVSELYGIDKKRSVLSVLPVTLVAVVATQLL
ncbi:hypothetical protein [Halopelagius longus]|uniref:Yip1 domain-containing protein n=1 Tax=Halopelagius longus TaxID=1236180 RepID=A0A1H1FN64_9EURY|nr:hypothetical protein [Halopelagius longus]RDI70035.1 hypothetical protein DWB78_15500 [Halopelagius longus]SDR01966.1 hypothetical protein SAMN05216278_3288 [Halopelagius longus]